MLVNIVFLYPKPNFIKIRSVSMMLLYEVGW